MDQAKQEKLIVFLSEKWGTRPCPLCGVARWNVLGKIFELREYHGGSLVVGSSSVMPVIPVTCSNCGNTVFVSAVLSGVIAPDSEKPQGEPTDKPPEETAGVSSEKPNEG